MKTTKVSFGKYEEQMEIRLHGGISVTLRSAPDGTLHSLEMVAEDTPLVLHVDQKMGWHGDSGKRLFHLAKFTVKPETT